MGIMSKANIDIRNRLDKFHITYAELIEHLPKNRGNGTFTHTQRIVEELSRELSEDRKKTYLLAIDKIKNERLREYEED